MCGGCPGPDLFLPKQTRSQPEKKKRLPHPFQGITIRKNRKGYCRNQKQKDNLMPMYNQFLSVGKKTTVTMPGYVPRETSTCCLLPPTSEVPTKPMYSGIGEDYQNAFKK